MSAQSIQSTGCSLNPLNSKLTCPCATVATIFSAITAAITVGGVLAILASYGINIGALNTIMGQVGMIGGGVAAGVGGLFLLATLSCLLVKIIQSCKDKIKKTKSKKETHDLTESMKRLLKEIDLTVSSKTRAEKQHAYQGELEHINTDLLDKVFVDGSNPLCKGSTDFHDLKQNKKVTLHFTEETTLQNVLEKLALEFSTEENPQPPKSLRLFLRNHGEQIQLQDIYDSSKKWEKILETYNVKDPLIFVTPRL